MSDNLLSQLQLDIITKSTTHCLYKVNSLTDCEIIGSKDIEIIGFKYKIILVNNFKM